MKKKKFAEKKINVMSNARFTSASAHKNQRRNKKEKKISKNPVDGD